MAPMMLIFSIAMGADYSFYVKSIATFALTFFGYNFSVCVKLSKYPQAEQTAIASSLSSQSSLPVKANLSLAKSSSSNP